MLIEFSSRAHNNTPKENNQENNVPQDFMFDYTSNTSNSSQNQPKSSPLSFFYSTPDIQGPIKIFRSNCHLGETRSLITNNAQYGAI